MHEALYNTTSQAIHSLCYSGNGTPGEVLAGNQQARFTWRMHRHKSLLMPCSTSSSIPSTSTCLHHGLGQIWRQPFFQLSQISSAGTIIQTWQL